MKPPGFSTRMHSPNSAGRSSTHWKHRLEYSTSTLWSASGRFVASAHTRMNGFSQLLCCFAARSIGSARSSAITSALGYFCFSSVVPRPVPAPTSTTRSGASR